MVSDERYVQILSGVERIKQEKPYGAEADAVAALDWLSSAGSDLRGGLNNAEGDVAQIARLQGLLETVDALHASVTARMQREGDAVPTRHHNESDVHVEL